MRSEWFYSSFTTSLCYTQRRTYAMSRLFHGTLTSVCSTRYGRRDVHLHGDWGAVLLSRDTAPPALLITTHIAEYTQVSVGDWPLTQPNTHKYSVGDRSPITRTAQDFFSDNHGASPARRAALIYSHSGSSVVHARSVRMTPAGLTPATLIQ